MPVRESIAKRTKSLLAKYGISAQKSRGQHFLIDRHVVDKIAAAAIPPAEVGRAVVVEIGPGTGILTRALAARAGRVLAIELDGRLAPVLAENSADRPNVEVIWADALAVNLDDLIQERVGAVPYAVVGNLPYYITSPLLMHLLEDHRNITSLVLMVQQEVAARLLAGPGSRVWGALGVAVQFYSKVEKVMRVPKEAFWPQPSVGSAVIRLQVREGPPVPVEDVEFFFRLVRGAFNQRRKILLNSLAASLPGWRKEDIQQAMAEGGIPWQYRAEQLSLAQWAVLAQQLQNLSARRRDA